MSLESKKLSAFYKKIAEKCKYYFIKSESFIKSSDIDGRHFDGKDLENFGIEIAKVVKQVI